MKEYDPQGSKTDPRAPAYDDRPERADELLEEIAIGELCSGAGVDLAFHKLGECVGYFTEDAENLKEIISVIMEKDSRSTYPRLQNLINTLTAIMKQAIVEKEKLDVSDSSDTV